MHKICMKKKKGYLKITGLMFTIVKSNETHEVKLTHKHSCPLQTFTRIMWGYFGLIIECDQLDLSW